MAATFGYSIFLVRVAVARRPRAVERVNECGPDGRDLFDIVTEAFQAMGDGFRSELSDAEGFRRKEYKLSGRAAWVKIYKGPAGIEGETYDMDTGESVPTSERQALLSGLRAVIILPENSYYGLLFVERIGRRNLKQLLEKWVFEPATHMLRGSLVRLEAFAETSDWQLLLADKQVLQVSEFLKSQPGDDASTAEEKTVKVTVTGTALRNLTDGIRTMVLDRVTRKNDRAELITEAARLEAKRVATQQRAAGPDAFTIQDQEKLDAVAARLQELDTHADRSIAELIDSINPVGNPSDQGLMHSSYEVSLGTRRPERVFSVERDSMPQFVYETSRRLSDSELWAAWVSHAETILENRGVSLPTGWVGSDPTAT
ncbi:hypothetical protein PDG61_21015 [Mycolicibacterium sp. BiH015]|uniref:hypothetical protein n=1 Tax=Mycolicibacterium sp. BiH015 TaxID=3018808 RepID=UPI0022E16CEC|nr:hypothetical protein [Mycolicibacterium sp. BiH015]MDA2893409.1 hypothetical protein [Mycolicibacterium sp. BiH015]